MADGNHDIPSGRADHSTSIYLGTPLPPRVITPTEEDRPRQRLLGWLSLKLRDRLPAAEVRDHELDRGPDVHIP
jgi:hypothetical protein